MTSISETSIVYNEPNKIIGLPPFYYRWRKCDTNLTSQTPANQYQKLKQIQNTVRVYGSLYTANLGPLTAYKQPITNSSEGFYGVCWNQMSDRPIPSVQKATIPTGTNTSMNKRHTSVTSSRPGCQTPGGVGCDIKHNSYDRYLNRLKGKGPMRRGPVPPNFGSPIPFNNALPIYGGKTIKTNIVNSCNCPITNNGITDNEKELYVNPLAQAYPVASYTFSLGEYVYAIQSGQQYYTRAQITNINNEIYTITFDNGVTQTETNPNNFLLYFPCNCNGTINNITYPSGFIVTNGTYYPQPSFI